MRMILEDLGRSTGEWELKTRQILQNFFGELDLDLIANGRATQHSIMSIKIIITVL